MTTIFTGAILSTQVLSARRCLRGLCYGSPPFERRTGAFGRYAQPGRQPEHFSSYFSWGRSQGPRRRPRFRLSPIPGGGQRPYTNDFGDPRGESATRRTTSWLAATARRSRSRPGPCREARRLLDRHCMLYLSRQSRDDVRVHPPEQRPQSARRQPRRLPERSLLAPGLHNGDSCGGRAHRLRRRLRRRRRHPAASPFRDPHPQRPPDQPVSVPARGKAPPLSPPRRAATTSS